MKHAAIILILFFSAVAYAQESQVTGLLVDSATAEVLPFAHVQNYTSEVSVVSSERGHFQLPAKLGDTIVFSSVGYETLGWVVGEDWISGSKTIRLPQDTVLLEDVIVSEMPTEAEFKQRVIEYQPEDTTFWYHGMPLPKEKSDPTLSEKSINNPLFAILQPTDFLYHRFSKREKERRKYHKILQRQRVEQAAYTKFSRQWIGEMTQLEGDVLTDFIEYCDYSLEYLERTPQYMILEDMLAKLDTFKREYKG